MRAGGMLRKASAGRSRTSAPLFLILLVLASHASALPLQYLPEIPGYIPVYIRHGNQPLEEINPALAEAFRESTGILKHIKEIPLDEPAPENPNKDLTDRNDVSLDSKEESIPPISSKQLIYNLPEEKNKYPQKSKSTEKESVVMKVPKSSPSEKIDAKKLTKELKQKEENK